MVVGVLGLLILVLLAGLVVIAAGVGLVLFLVLRKKRQPQGFEVLTGTDQKTR